MENQESPVETVLLQNGWRKGTDGGSRSRAIYWLTSLTAAADLFGHADYCRTNDKPPSVLIYEYSPLHFDNGNKTTWGYELRLVSDTGNEWVDLRFYSLEAKDIHGPQSKLKKLGSQLIRMWNLAEKRELDDE